MTIRKHRDVVKAWLSTDLPGAVFTSYAAANLERYAVLFTALTSKTQHRYSMPPGRDVYTFTVHSVGESEDQCLWVQERVVKLANQTLSVPGRALFPLQFIMGRVPELDEGGPAPLWFAVTQFDMISDPVKEDA